MKVLHYKSNFLNTSETFIKRLIDRHKCFEPAGMCIHKRELLPSCPVFEKPGHGISGVINTLCFHLNWKLPFYDKVISNYQPNIIHAHFGFDGYRMIGPSIKAGIPLAVSFYGSDVSRLPGEFDWLRRYRNLAGHADAFIAASSLMKKQLTELGFPGSKIEVVRFGLDLEKFEYSSTRVTQKNMMMVGRMVEKKGFTYALEAVKLLNQWGMPIRLDLYGDGELKNNLNRKACEWEIEHLVTFHGFQSVEVIRQACQSHSLLLVPSITATDDDREGIPNTLIEGMASGIPVIASRNSAIPEVIIHQKNGLLVDEKDPEALARAIQSIINEDADVASMRKNARRHIEEYYDIYRMVEQVEDIYKRAIDR